jgi:hypothetical protein
MQLLKDVIFYSSTVVVKKASNTEAEIWGNF